MITALVIEDSLTDLQIISRCLQEDGINVLAAQSKKEAIVILLKLQPDVVVLDVILPDSNGFKLCRELKTLTNTSHIPIVICSTKGSEIDKIWGMKQGADAYLVKPINQEELVNTVKSLIKG